MMSTDHESDPQAAPEPHVDQDVDRAPGGVDASSTESDVGAASEPEPLTPDAPSTAQRSDTEVPEGILEPEEPDESATEPSGETVSEPSA